MPDYLKLTTPQLAELLWLDAITHEAYRNELTRRNFAEQMKRLEARSEELRKNHDQREM